MAGNEVAQYGNDSDTSYKSSPGKKWWLTGTKTMYDEIFSVVRWVRGNQNYRSVANLRYARLYSNMEILGLQAFNFARSNNVKNFMTNRVTYNVIKNTTDTAVAKIGKERPRPIFLTEKGNYGMQQKAKKLTQYMDGQFSMMRVYPKARLAFRDACVFGSGAVKIFKKDHQVHMERILTDEVLVDDTEAMYGEPRQMYQIKNIDRQVVVGSFPKHEKEILKSNNLDKGGAGSKVIADMITVVEAWHLPSSPGADDGKHVICSDNVTLFEEPWERERFPIEFFYWHHAIIGFWGVGIAEELVGIQLEINKLLRNVQIAQNLVAVPRVWLEASNKVNKANIGNQIGSINTYVGNPPVFQTPTAMNAEIYGHIETLYAKAFEITGLSHMAATGEKPAGVDSAVGMRTLNDIGSQRFADVQLAWEDFHTRIAEQTITCTKEIQKDLNKAHENKEEGVPKTLEVRMQSSKFMQSIKWSQVDIPEESYVLRVFPTGILPSEPAGKLEKVMELTKAGFMEKDDALDLLEFPDLEKVRSRMTSGTDLILKVLDIILVEGRYIAPEPFMNLNAAKLLSQQVYMQASIDNAPPDRLEMVIQFMEAVKQLLEPTPEIPLVGPGPVSPPGPEGPLGVGGPELPPGAPMGEEIPLEAMPGAEPPPSSLPPGLQGAAI